MTLVDRLRAHDSGHVLWTCSGVPTRIFLLANRQLALAIDATAHDFVEGTDKSSAGDLTVRAACVDMLDPLAASAVTLVEVGSRGLPLLRSALELSLRAVLDLDCALLLRTRQWLLYCVLLVLHSLTSKDDEVTGKYIIKM